MHVADAARLFEIAATGDADDPAAFRGGARALAALRRKDDAAAKRAEADKAEARLRVPLDPTLAR